VKIFTLVRSSSSSSSSSGGGGNSGGSDVVMTILAVVVITFKPIWKKIGGYACSTVKLAPSNADVLNDLIFISAFMHIHGLGFW
jgi:hypothetical protein